MTTSAIVILVVIVVLVLWAISVYNGLVTMRQRVNQAFADVDVQLRQRHDLVPNLVETVKGYAAHERGTLDEVIKARGAAVSAQGPAQQAAAENVLTTMPTRSFRARCTTVRLTCTGWPGPRTRSQAAVEVNSSR